MSVILDDLVKKFPASDQVAVNHVSLNIEQGQLVVFLGPSGCGKTTTLRIIRQVSGGEAQRVALARAMVRRPNVFLMDEPLSSLDAKLRIQLRTEIKRLHQNTNSTIIFVTHDQEEAMVLGDVIVVMDRG